MSNDLQKIRTTVKQIADIDTLVINACGYLEKEAADNTIKLKKKTELIYK